MLRRRRKIGFLDQINRVFDISRKVQRDFEKAKENKKGSRLSWVKPLALGSKSVKMSCTGYHPQYIQGSGSN